MSKATINIDIDARRAQKATKDLDKSVGEFSKQTVSARTRLRNMIDEMNNLEVGSQRFNEISREAAVLRDQMDKTNATVRALSDDFFLLRGATDVISGIGGAFNVATGAMALFGSENEVLEEAMQKIVVVMGITNGLQQVSNLLRKESSAMILLQQIRTGALNVVSMVRNRILTTENVLTRQSTILKNQNTIATNTASVATRGLGIAMNALPIMAILTGIGLLIGAFMSMGDSVDDVSDSVEDMTDRFKKFDDTASEYTNNLNKMVKNNELAVRLGTKTDEEATEERRQLIRQRIIDLDNERAQIQHNMKTMTKFSKERTLAEEALQKIESNRTQAAIDLLNIHGKRREEDSKRAEELEKKRKRSIEEQLELDTIYFNRREKLRQDDLKSITKWSDEVIDETQDLSEEMIDIIDDQFSKGADKIIQTGPMILSDSITSSMNSIAKGFKDGTVKFFDDYRREVVMNIDVLESEFDKLSQKGSDIVQKSYEDELSLMERRRDIKLSEAETEKQIQIINETFFDEKLKLDNQRLENMIQVQKSLNEEKRAYEELIQINQILNKEISFGDRNMRSLNDLSLERLESEIKSVELYNEVNKQKMSDFKEMEEWKLMLETQFIEKSLSNEEDKLKAASKMRLQDAIENLEKQFTEEQKQTELYLNTINRLKTNAELELQNDLEIIRKEFREKEIRLEQQHIENLKNHREPLQLWLDEHMQAIDEVMFQMYDAMNAFQQATAVAAENASIQREEQFRDETHNLDNELSQQLIDREEYDARVRQLEDEKQRRELASRRKQFLSDKRNNIGRAIMDGAGAILRAIQQFGPPPSPLGILGMSAATGITAAQVATISGQQFKASRGGVVPGNQRTNTDSVSALLAPGETIINSKASRLFPQLLSTINQIGGGVPLAPEPTRSERFNGNQTIKVNVGVDEISNVQDRLTRYSELNEF